MSKIRLKSMGQSMTVEKITKGDLSPKTLFAFNTVHSGNELTAGEWTVTPVADVNKSLTWKGFRFESANRINQYYVWFNIDGERKDPNFIDAKGIEVKISANASINAIATAIVTAINATCFNITASINGNIVTIKNTIGVCDDIVDGGGFDFSALTDLTIYTIEGYFYHRPTGDISSKIPTKIPFIKRVNQYEITEFYH